MRFTKLIGVAAASALAFGLSACGSEDEGGSGGKTYKVGIKFDQPGLGLKQPDGSFKGLDVDVANYIAKELGGKVEFKEAKSAERENLIQNGDVDFIVATYSITDTRKEKVAFAGPYFVAHQDLLVRADDSSITGPDAMKGKKLCSVTGSTSAQKVKDNYSKDVQLQEYKTYSECVDALESKAIDAVTTDDTILAGFAAQRPGKFKLVGKGFSDERYGIGLKKDNADLKGKINAAITKMISDGSWAKYVEANLGPAGYKVPSPPTVSE